MEKLQLKCIDCGGVLEVDPTRKILSCPYCGSKQLMIDSDEVKIAEINAKAYENVETIKSYNEVEKEKIRKEPILKGDQLVTVIWLIIIFAMLIFLRF